LRPRALIRDLDLLKPIYRQTSNYGHFGRDDVDFTWERTTALRHSRKPLAFSILADTEI